jgi:hypothetical protein
MDEIQIIELFCLVDDFANKFSQLCSQKQLHYQKKKIRNRLCRTSLSEVMVILLLFHRSNYRTFKHFYLQQVRIQWKHLFPNIVKYSRFVQLTSDAFFPMFCFVRQHQGVWGDVQFIDSTVLTSCHVKRASSHRTFRHSAKWGKTTTGWFFGFKLHLVINQHAEIVAFRLTSGNVDDRKPLPDMLKPMKGKGFADRGYISEKLRIRLLKMGILLITKLKKNMKNKLMTIYDKWMLRKRAIIESVHNLLKSACQIEHHRHRSRWNFLSNLFSGLGAYCLNPNKPRLYFPTEEINELRAVMCSSMGLR